MLNSFQTKEYRKTSKFLYKDRVKVEFEYSLRLRETPHKYYVVNCDMNTYLGMELDTLHNFISANSSYIDSLYFGVTEDYDIAFDTHVNNNPTVWNNMHIIFTINKCWADSARLVKYIETIKDLFNESRYLNKFMINVIDNEVITGKGDVYYFYILTNEKRGY